MKIGYARVSTKWYQRELQIAEFERHGCESVHCITQRHDFAADQKVGEMIDKLSPGDTVIVTRLSSVAYSFAELLHLLEQIEGKKAFFKSLAEPWADTKANGGRQLIDTIRGLIDFEMTLADMKNQSDNDRPNTIGVSPGRPQKLSERQKYEAISLLSIGKTATEIGRLLGVSRSTISRLKSASR